jgi:ATP synthase assembly factor FMC1, mitochondrial
VKIYWFKYQKNNFVPGPRVNLRLRPWPGPIKSIKFFYVLCQKLRIHTGKLYSMEKTAVTNLYRALYREIMVQRKAAVEVQKSLDSAKNQLLLSYRKNMARKSSQPHPEPIRQHIQFDDGGIALLREVLKEGSDKDLKFGHEVLNYLKNQRVYSELLERYNPGLDEGQERVKLSARRVGLELPE